MASCFAAGIASANPTGPQVVNGAAAFQNPNASTLAVSNTPGAVINWQGFSIGAGEVTRFIQQSSSSAVLNRVVSGDVSQIYGQLLSNGRVFLINPGGILVGPGAIVDTAGFVASTLNMVDADFIAGKLKFQGDANSGSITNQGWIRTGYGGKVVLVAPHIENSGLIHTPGGELILAAGQKLTVSSLDHEGVQFDVQAPTDSVVNLGKLLAEGGAIGVFAGTLKHSGDIRATSLSKDSTGQIVLKAQGGLTLDTGSVTSASGAQGGTVKVDGSWVGVGGDIRADGENGGGRIDITAGGYSLAATMSTTGGSGAGGAINVDVAGKSLENVHAKIDVSGARGGSIRHVAGRQITTSGTYLANGTEGRGGRIDLSAPATKLLSAQLHADGAAGGGQVRIGGEFQGGKGLAADELPNAELLAISAGSVITANATQSGAGGSVVTWANIEAAMYGDVSARPASGGLGGFIEISSGDKLTYGGTASAGFGGTVLFDPKNITIGTASGGASQYSIVLGYNYADVQRLKGNDLEAGDQFGVSVSLSGTQLAVGANRDDGAGNITADAGAVYLITNPFTAPALAGVIGKGYTGTGNLNVTALAAGDDFGVSVSLSGAQLVVGAEQDNGALNDTTNAGAVYLINNPFSATPALAGVIGKGYTGPGNFDVSALEAGDLFGHSVSLSGTQLAVAAHRDDGAGNVTSGAGAVYLFNTPFTAPALAGIIGKGYTGTGNLDISTLGVDALFGTGVSLVGTQLAIGASNDDGSGGGTTDAGAVFLISNPFTAPTLAGIIGKGYTGTGNLDVGALAAGDSFGSSVSLSGTQLVVGALNDDGATNATADSGAVYLINNPFSATPTLAGVIGKGYTGSGNFDVSALAAGDFFGRSVSISGTQLVVGAQADDAADNASTNVGAVYLFNNPFTAPALVGVIGKGYAGSFDVSALEAGDGFGSGVSLSGTQLAVGAPLDDGAGNTATNAGAVYLFNNPFTAPALAGVIGKGYTGSGSFNVSALEANDRFGTSVSLSGTQLAVGAHFDDGPGNATTDAGAVYLFNTPFSAPALAGVIGKGYTGAGNFDVSALEAGDLFGFSVALSGTQLAVGAVNDDGAGNATGNSGAVYLFNNPFTASALTGVIGKGYTGAGNFDVSALGASDLFGYSLSLSGTQLAVGAVLDDGAGNAADASGAVYLFNTPFTAPALAAVIGKGYTGAGNFDVGALESGDEFGRSVSLAGAQLAVGAISDDGAGNVTANAGAVYLFNNPFTAPAIAGVIGKGYTGAGNFDVSALEANDQFGYSVSLSSTQLAVGANVDDGAGNASTDAGAVYLFNNPFTAPALAGVIGKGYSGIGNFDVSALKPGDLFGWSVSFSGAQLAVGAPFDDGAGDNVAQAGAVYLFNNPFTAPALAGVIGKGYTGTGNLDVGALAQLDNFGTSVSLSGTQLAVGAPRDDGFGNATGDAGAVYLINDPFTAPALAGVIGKGYTGADNFDVTALAADDRFGTSVALDGTQLAVGAYRDDGFANNLSDAGAVYLFNNPFTAPALSGIMGFGYVGAGDFNVSALQSQDYFGTSVSLSGTQLAVGAPRDDGAGSTANAVRLGAVYLFSTPFATPTLAGVIGRGYTGAGNLSISLADGDLFGSSVSISGTMLAVGAPGDGGASNTALASGAVSLFNNPFSATPTQAGIIGRDYSAISGPSSVDVTALAASDFFGISVSLSGTQLAVGAYGDDGAGTGAGATAEFGAVYGFNLAGGGGDTVASATFANNPGADSTITPASITAITNGGTAVVLQANNDITLAAGSPITTTATGPAGSITLQAGRSVLLNANITTANGNLTVTSNDPLAIAANRDAGAGGITMAAGTTLNAGTGTVALTVGAGVAGAASGNLVVENITAANVNLQQNGRTSGSSILRASSSSLIVATNLLMEVDSAGLASGGSIGTSAAPIRVQVSTLEAHTHEASPGIFIESPNAGNLQIGGVPFFGGSVKGVQNVTSGDVSIAANGTITIQGGTAGCGATGGTGGPVCTTSGNITLRGDDMNVSNAVNAAAGSVTLTPFSTTRDILLISPTAPPPGLILDTLELPRVTAGTTLEIGRSSDTGTLTVTTGLNSTHINAGTLKLAHQNIALNQTINFSAGGESLTLTSGSAGAANLASITVTAPLTINGRANVASTTFADNTTVSGLLTLPAGNMLTVNSGKTLTLNGGLSADATNVDTVVSGGGTVAIPSGATATLTSGGGDRSFYFDNVTVNNAGTVALTFTDSFQRNDLVLNNGTVLNNQAGGQITFSNTGNQITTTAGSGTLNNSGSIAVVGGTPGSYLTVSTLNLNTGSTLNAASTTMDLASTANNYNGTLALTGNVRMTGGTHTLADGTVISGSGTLDHLGGTVLMNNVTLNKALSLGAGTTLTVNPGKTLTLGGGLSADATNVDTVVSGGGTVAIPSGATATLTSGGGDKSFYFDNVTVNNAGTLALTFTDSFQRNDLVLNNGTVLNNQAGAQITFSNTGNQIATTAGSGTLNNSGGLVSAGASANLTVTTVSNLATGAIDLSGGSISGALTNLGSINVSSGTGTVTGATFDMNAGNLTIAGGATFVKDGGAFNWSGGALGGSGAFSTANGASFNIVGAGARVVNGPTFSLSSLTLPAGSLELQSGALNVSGATTINSGATLQISGGTFGPSGAFNNDGTFNLGTGTTSLAGGGTHAGSFSVASGATVNFAGGTHNLNDGVTLAGGGTYGITGGAFNVTGTITGTTLAAGATLQTGGNTLGGAGKLTNLGTVDASGSTLNLNVINQGTFSVAAGNTNVTGGLIQQAGTINVAPGQTLTVGGTGLDWQGGSLLGTSAASYSLSALTFSGSGARVLDGPTFNFANLTLPGGSMTLQSGALNLSGTTTIASGATLAAAGGAVTAIGPLTVGGTLQASAAGPVNAAGQTVTVPTAGVLDVNGGTVTAGLVDVTGGLVKGAGTLAANVNNSAGTVAPGASPGILNVSGNYVQGPSGTLAAEIGGTAPGTQYDQLAVIGNVSLDGSLDVTLLGGFVPAASDTFNLITAGGTLTGTFATTNIPVSAAGFTGSYPASGFDLVSSPSGSSSSTSGIGMELVLREVLLQDLVTDLALAAPLGEQDPRRVAVCR